MTIKGTSPKTWEALLHELRNEFVVREAELELLHEIDLRILTSDEEIRDTLRFIARETAALLSAATLQLYLRRGTSLEPGTCEPADAKRYSFSWPGTPFERCIQEKLRLNVDGVHAEEIGPHVGGLRLNGKPKSVLAVPICLGETVLGVMLAARASASIFDQKDEEIANAVAAQVAIALENAELFDQAELFATVDRLIFSTSPTEEVLQDALDVVLRELKRLDYAEVNAAQLLFLRPDQTELEIVHSTVPRDVGLVVSIDDSVSGRALREKRTIVVNDVTQDPEYKRLLGPEIRSEIVIPILVGAESVAIGVLNVESPVKEAFGGIYQLMLSRFARKVTMLLAVTRLRAEMPAALDSFHSSQTLIAIGDRATDMVHKLNNIVGAMRVEIQEIRANCEEEVAGSEFLRTALDNLSSAADDTLKLPRSVVAFIAHDSEPELVRVDDAVAQALERLEVPDSVNVEWKPTAELPAIPAYSLDLAIENVLKNSLDAMPDGGSLRIEKGAVVVPGLAEAPIEIRVTDSGCGMTEEVKRRMFEIDFTTKPERKGKGLGVGMWWVRQWVRRSRGEIEVQSAPGDGTTVTMRLPAPAPTADTN